MQFQPAQTNLFQGVHEWQTLLKLKNVPVKTLKHANTTLAYVQWFVLILKRTVAAIAAGDYATASEAYKTAVPVIDRMADKGIIHKNKAARHKSRLNAQIKALAN